MQKLPETPNRKRGDACTKKRNKTKERISCSFSAVTSGGTTPKSFLLLVERAMCPSIDDVLANFSTSSSRLFY